MLRLTCTLCLNLIGDRFLNVAEGGGSEIIKECIGSYTESYLG